jgi:hypothetical protein
MRRHDLAAAAYGRETRGEDDLVARLVRIVDRMVTAPSRTSRLP